jgi:integrase
MRAPKPSLGKFEKVGQCLYRYSSNGVYYARIKTNGKEIRRSLKTIDRKKADRDLKRLKEELDEIDPSRGKLTLAELCDQYLEATDPRLKEKTVERRELIVRRIKEDWPTGKLTQVRKVKPSDVDKWITRYPFGRVSRNLHRACVNEIFDMAIRDNVIARSPAAHLKRLKPDKPIRKTPTFEEFKAIVADIRAQQFNADAEGSADFVEFLGLAGLGQAEASALKKSDIDWKRKTIVTFRHKTKSGFVIPIYPQLHDLLQRRCAMPGPDKVFEIRDAKKAIAGACTRLGLPHYSHRAFRRMFITRAIERGVDVAVIAEWQGHKDGGKLILSTYSHVNRLHSQRMAKLMDDSQPENVIPIKTAGVPR